jgi:hypothetical protein
VYSGRTGAPLHELHGACLGFGHADLDHDGHADLLVTHNTSWRERTGDIDEVWNQASLEVISGSTGAVLRSISRDTLRRLTR